MMKISQIKGEVCNFFTISIPNCDFESNRIDFESNSNYDFDSIQCVKISIPF